MAVDVDSQLITEVDVIPGNESDGKSAQGLVEASEANTGWEVEQVIGDTAYGSMETRKELGDREVIAPTVKPHSGRSLSKDDFQIDLANDRVVCPEGHETTQGRWVWVRSGRAKARVQTKQFTFPKEVCRACPRRTECYTEKRKSGQTITLHPDEARLQAARALERTEYFREQYRRRVVVEHRVGRLVQLGIRQARYFGRKKTRFQVLMAATVANLTLLAGKEASEGVFRRVLGSLGVLCRRIRSLMPRSTAWRAIPVPAAA